MPVSDRAYNLSAQNKWVLVLPYKKIDDTLTADSVVFNLCNFTIPALEIGSTDFNIYGRSIPWPTGAQNEDKNLRFDYMLSSDWHQYKILYKWFSKVSYTQTNAPTTAYKDYVLDLSVMLLSEYKNPIFSINYKGCWISAFDELQMDYQSNQDNVKHGFNIKYSLYEFEDFI